MAKNSNKKSKALKSAIVFICIIIMVLVVVLVISIYRNKQFEMTTEEQIVPEELSEDSAEEIPDKNVDNTIEPIIPAADYKILPNENGVPVAQIDIDIDEIKDVNPDVRGWIYIPDTGIDCAIVCNADDPDYYIMNDIDNLNGVFIQNYNNSDFSDRMTVIYGKNQNDISQFEGLIKYRDKSFFDGHRYIYVEAGDKLLTYKIFAARKAYAEHLMLGYDWSNDQIFLDYLTYIIKSGETFEISDVVTALDIDPDAIIDSTANVSMNDKILTLSQRIDGEDDYRYLVQGVLINESIKEAP